MKVGRVYEYLLAHHTERITQKRIAKTMSVSASLVNKVIKELVNENVIVQPKKNVCLVINPVKLLLIHAIKYNNLSKPITLECGYARQDIEGYLENSGVLYALCLESAYNKRIPLSYEHKTRAYVLTSHVKELIKDVPRRKKGRLIIYPMNKHDFYACGKINNTRVTPLMRTISDLITTSQYNLAKNLWYYRKNRFFKQSYVS